MTTLAWYYARLLGGRATVTHYGPVPGDTARVDALCGVKLPFHRCNFHTELPTGHRLCSKCEKVLLSGVGFDRVDLVGAEWAQDSPSLDVLLREAMQ